MFCLVGIAEKIDELVLDHKSIERKLVPIHLAPMHYAERVEVVELAEVRLRSAGFRVGFSSQTKDRLATISSGFPWFIHVIGQRAVLTMIERGFDELLDEEITELDIDDAAAWLREDELAQKFNLAYRQAVGSSALREKVLRLLASVPTRDIPSSQVIHESRRLGIKEPGRYVRQLCSREYGEVIFRPQPRGVWRFHEEMFKALVRLAGVEHSASS